MANIIKQLGYVGIWVMLLAGVVFGYNWPSSDAQLLENFGQRTALRRVQKGLLMSTRVASITPIEQGEVIFSAHEQSLLPSRKGGSVVIAHENHLLSGYSNIQVSADRQGYEEQNLALKLTESTSLMQYQLYLYDAKVKQYINPALFLPLGRSGSRVVIEQVMVQMRDGREYVLYNGAVLPSGYARIYLASYALSGMGRRLGVQEASLQVLGNSLASVGFNAIIEEDGNAYLAGDKPILLQNLYNEQGMLHLAEAHLLEGQLNMVVRVINLDGERQESTMRIRVVN